MVTRLFYHWPPVPLVTRAHLRSCLGWIAAVVYVSAEIAKFYTNFSISTRSTLQQRCLAHGDWSTSEDTRGPHRTNIRIAGGWSIMRADHVLEG